MCYQSLRMDKSETQDELRQAEADLRRLKKDMQLPPLMEFKLSYLSALLNQSQFKQDFAQRLEPEERQAIEDLPFQTKKRLLIDTVRCLSGQETLIYCRNERAYLRREGKLFSWQKCYLECSTNLLILLRKKENKDYFYKFQLQRVCISKNYKKYKGKYVLAIDFEAIKYIIGFDMEITCKRIHNILGELIAQKKEWQATLYDNNKFIEERQKERLALPAHRVKQIIYQQEYQHLLALQEKVKLFDNLKETDFQLFKNTFEGRVLTSKSGVVKTQIILKGVDIFTAASSYIQMAKWNKSIQLCDIVSRPRNNCWIANFKTKKYSMMSYIRRATLVFSFFKPCVCKKNLQSQKYFLFVQTLPENQNQANGGVAMTLTEVIQFIPNKQDTALLLVICHTKADFKGFCSQSDNLNMTLHITQQIDQYHKFSQSKTTKKQQQYFQNIACPCGFILDSDDVSLPTQRQELISQQNRGSISAIPMYVNFTQKIIIAAMQDISRGLINQEFIQIISSRSFQKYYLKHRFSQKDQSIALVKGEVKNFLNQGSRWKFDKEDLIFMDAQVLNAQKDILKMVLKQISVCIMQGKSVMNMSLPVEIFDKKSLLDAIPDSYGFLPAYAPRIAAAQDPVQQMKLMTCIFAFMQATDPNIQKPFNPILGQTYQGRLGDFQVYLQQISHHPPISAMFLKNDEMQLYGNLQIAIGMGLNCAYSHINDWLRAKVYKTGTEYMIKLTQIQIGGLVYGSRTYKFINKGCIFQKKNLIYCQFSVGKDKKRVYQAKPKPKPSDLLGGIFKINQQFAQQILSCKKPSSFDGIKPQNIVETYSLLSGKWYGDLYFNEVCYKSKKDGPFPMRGQKMKYVLPSDSIWREDVVYRIWKDFQRSNKQKQRMQNLQRNDRKLREKYKKNK